MYISPNAFNAFEDPAGLQHSAIAIAAVVVAGVMSSLRPHKQPIETLWVRPVVWAGLVMTELAGKPPSLTPLSLTLTLMLAGLAIGCAFGWDRGHVQRIEIDPRTRQLTTPGPPTAASTLPLLIFVLMLPRLGLHLYLAGHGGALYLWADTAYDTVLLLVAGMFVTRNLETWRRAGRLASKSARPTNGGNPPTGS